MKFLFASDSFKGTLSSERIIELLTQAAKDVFPECEVLGVPIADGGEGTVEALISATKGNKQIVQVHGPLMELTESYYGIIHEDTAVIEMAAASGLPMIPKSRRNPLNTTTYGTGELIREALDAGYRKIFIAIGGSATNDGGMGAMSALGIRFLDEDGSRLQGTGAELSKVVDIDVSELHPGVMQSEITVMCDVNNPLTGPEGATYTFGKQKGATPEILDEIEEGMKHYARIIRDQFGVDANEIPGAGAAGGLGAALCIFLQAKMVSGIETVLDLIDFKSLLDDVDIVITGEGRIDWQSAYGKVPSGVGKRCKEKGVPVIAIVGGIGEGAEKIYDFGVESIISTINGAMKIEEALERADELYISAAERLFRIIKVGMSIRNVNQTC